MIEIRSQHRASSADTRDEPALITRKVIKKLCARDKEFFFNIWNMFDIIGDKESFHDIWFRVFMCGAEKLNVGERVVHPLAQVIRVLPRALLFFLGMGDLLN